METEDTDSNADPGAGESTEDAAPQTEVTFVAEADELNKLVARTAANHGLAHPEDCVAFRRILIKYQEQPQLLDPHLEGLVEPLMGILQGVPSTESLSSPVLLKAKCTGYLLQTLCSVRGYKAVVRFFPHEAVDLERALSLLQLVRADPGASSPADPNWTVEGFSTQGWELEVVLLVWLSMLVIIPFDLATVDSQAGGTATPECSLEDRLVEVCKGYLSEPGPVRDAAAVVLGKLLTRLDMRRQLVAFVAWVCGPVLEGRCQKAQFQSQGATRALALVFKHGTRDLLLPLADRTLEAATKLQQLALRSGTLRKLAVRVVARVGLTYLPPRVATWRYQRGSRCLESNLKGSQEGVAAGAPPLAAGPSHQDLEEDTHNLTHPVLDQLEEVVEQLLVGLRDKDTVVRWAAAKGIGRVTMRLPRLLADDVVHAVLDLFTPIEGDGAWHGGCLAVAELARRGLLAPGRMGRVVAAAAAALAYDVRRGAHSVGAHVRDAAAYVCWALARAYGSEVLGAWLPALAPALLAAAVFDREVHCRRAAAAAFQEGVGRLGHFPHGIDLVTVADYFTIGVRSHAFCSVAPVVAAFPLYQRPLFEHLIYIKLRHWDISVRELSARALAALTPTNPSFAAGAECLDVLVAATLSSDLPTRHGSVLALAEVLVALADVDYALAPDTQAKVVGVVPAVEKARLYRGKGGEVMRAAVCLLIRNTARVGLPLTPALKKALHASIDENLRHPTKTILIAAAAALEAFGEAAMRKATPEALARTVGKYTALAGEANPAARRGAVLALGSLPRHIIVAAQKQVLSVLASAMETEVDPDARDAETRMHAAAALVKVAMKAGPAEPKQVDDCIAGGVLVEMVVGSLLRAIEDYATDNRGDVGSWVREEAMRGLEQMAYALARLRSPDGVCHLDRHLAGVVVAKLLKQAVEKIDRIRDQAGCTLARMLRCTDPPLANIPHRAELEAALAGRGVVNWASAGESFPALMPLLHLPEFRLEMVQGLVVSIGGLDPALSKAATTALQSYLSKPPPHPHHPEDLIAAQRLASKGLADALIVVAKQYAQSGRVMIPWMRALDILFSGAFANALDPADPFFAEVLIIVKHEAKGCKDVSKLVAMIGVLCHLFGLQPCGNNAPLLPTSRDALHALLVLLVNRYPKVRKCAAEQLYVCLLTKQQGDDENDVECSGTEEAMTILCSHQWDADLDVVRKARFKLFAPLQLEPPTTAVAALTLTAGSSSQVVEDEHESYASLVDMAGY